MEFYYIINIIAFVRLFFFFHDDPVTIKKLVLINILQVIPLFIFKINLELILFIIIIAAINVLFFYIERKNINLNLARFLGFAAAAFISGIFTSSAVSLDFNYTLLNQFKIAAQYSSLFNFINIVDWMKLNLTAMGILVILNEINFVIRYFFEIFSLVPKVRAGGPVSEVDEREYNAGRVIGMLERVLIYFFVLIGQFAAIGFIIAAKGFTRFKELDKREFAEYVLIGTLLSSLLAITIALITKFLIH